MQKNKLMETIIDYVAMGQRIKVLRLAKNLQQNQLADMLGISQTHMSNIELGRTGVILEHLVKMGQILQCILDDIVSGKEKNT